VTQDSPALAMQVPATPANESPTALPYEGQESLRAPVAAAAVPVLASSAKTTHPGRALLRGPCSAPA
jgi:hypothetical protein